MDLEKPEGQINCKSQPMAQVLLDQLRNGQELELSDIDVLIKELTENEFGSDVGKSDFDRLFKMRSRLVLEALNCTGSAQDAFGDEQEAELEFLVTALANNWFDVQADVTLVHEFFEMKIDGLIDRMKNDGDLDDVESELLISSYLNGKLTDENSQLVKVHFNFGLNPKSESDPERSPQLRGVGDLPLNFSIETFDIYIGYIDGTNSNYKEASLYRNERHMLSVKIAIKLDTKEVDINELLEGLYLCSYVNSDELPTMPGNGLLFYGTQMNSFTYLLDPKDKQRTWSAASRSHHTTSFATSKINHEVMTDGTILAEFYVSARGLESTPAQISAGLKTKNGLITTALYSTNTIMANGSNWTGKSNVIINTLTPIDYAQSENIRLEDKHNKNASMWRKITDLTTTFREFYTDCTKAGFWACGGKDDYKGHGAKGEILISPKEEDFEFKIKTVTKGQHTDNTAANTLNMYDDFPNIAYWEGGDDCVKASVVFIERERPGIRGGSLRFKWRQCLYTFFMNNKNNSYREFVTDHTSNVPLDDGKIHINYFTFTLDKSSLWSDARYSDHTAPEKTEVEVYDSCGNRGVITISAVSQEWPSLRINRALL